MSHHFGTDQQTLDDLNLFGRHGGDSIYNLFNRCITRGGAAILEDMFRYPLSDANAINRRTGIMQFFAAAGTAFPFKGSHFDSIEPYLANTDERTRLGAGTPSLTQKLSSLIAPDVETVLVHKGVMALLELLNGLHDFLGTLESKNAVDYRTDMDAIHALLSEPGLESVLQWTSREKLTQPVIAAYDVLFRFRHRDAIQKLLRYVYHLDVYLSVARVAGERGFVFPKALPPAPVMVKLQGVYHPQVKGAIANDVHITPGGNVIFLTGANMAGKSTFMKSLSIALFLAHMGFPVAATFMEFAVLDGMYTTINLPDNLGMGASHFYAEVLRVKKMAYELSRGRRLFIVFDELFRGTNVKDAYEATIAITAAFAERTDSLFVISTHIIEAGAVLKQRRDNVRFVYLPTRMDGNKPVYTYQLQEGITDDRHGMIIINNEGILDILEAGLQTLKAV
jgi:DNA mismatch repair protein MutS